MMSHCVLFLIIYNFQDRFHFYVSFFILFRAIDKFDRNFFNLLKFYKELFILY